MALDRSKKHEERRQRLIDEQRRMLADELNVDEASRPGTPATIGGAAAVWSTPADTPIDIDAVGYEVERCVVMACRIRIASLRHSSHRHTAVGDEVERTIGALVRSRQKLIGALHRGKQLEEKVALFRRQVDDTDSEIRRLRRALRMLETNATLQALGPSKRELEEITSDFEAKQLALGQLQALLHSRIAMLDYSNAAAQRLKGVVAEREARASRCVELLHALSRRMHREQGALRLHKDRLDEQISERQNVLDNAKKRLRQVRVELSRVQKHDGKWVNCDVWNPGVMQRMLTIDLLSHLTHESRVLGEVIENMGAHVENLSSERGTVTGDGQAVSDNIHTVGSLVIQVEEAYKAAAEKSIAEELAELINNQTSAASTRDVEAAEAAVAARAAAAGQASLAGLVRQKNASERSREEKHWVACDVLLNPQLYSHVTEAEAEDMKYVSAPWPSGSHSALLRHPIRTRRAIVTAGTTPTTSPSCARRTSRAS